MIDHLILGLPFQCLYLVRSIRERVITVLGHALLLHQTWGKEVAALSERLVACLVLSKHILVVLLSHLEFIALERFGVHGQAVMI